MEKMGAKTISVAMLAIASALFVACSSTPQRDLVQENFDVAQVQIEALLAGSMKGGVGNPPGAYVGGEIDFIPIGDWTGGFFAGTLWQLYDWSVDEKWRDGALKYTELLNPIQHLTWHHDVGFIINSSYGNAIKYINIKEYRDVITTTAESLSTRYNPEVGAIISWDIDRGWQAERGWHYPVIINGLMNLELLFVASQLSGDQKYYDIAVSHADRTLENAFRSDGSTYHVVDYNPQDGEVMSRCTAHGYSDESTWTRGQAWAIYGFAMCYRYTGDKKYLDQAQKACDFYLSHPNLPENLVPYWDFDVPDIPNALRDVSSAAITCSALYELYYHTYNRAYRQKADKIMENLSCDEYRSQVGENGGFILKHTVGGMHQNNYIDVATAYADYYFVEALLRRDKIENKTKLF